MLLNAAKSQVWSFYRFSVIKIKPKGPGGKRGGVKLLPPYPDLFLYIIKKLEQICKYLKNEKRF